MTKSEREVLQQDLALNLLRYSNGTPATLEATSETERICKLVFLTCYPLGNNCLSTALLEALLMLSEVSPGFSAEFLSCVLLLSVCSIEAWHVVSRSILFKKYPDVSNLLAKIIAVNNPCWRNWPQEEQEKVSSACVSLSDLDLYVKEGCVCVSTPISIALKSLQTNLSRSKSAGGHRLESDYRTTLVSRIPLKVWGSIAPSDLFFVLQVAVEAEIPTARFLPHLSKRCVIDSREIRKFLYVLRTKGFDSAEGIFHTLFGKNMNESAETPTQITEDFLAAKDPVDAREAYNTAKKATSFENSNMLKDAARKWTKIHRLDLVSAAYLAEPKLLSRVVGSSEEICEIIRRLPLSLYSPVDETIDRALSGLLCQIPELVAITSRYSVHGANGSNSLKKAALIYPFITLRRTKCMCAAGQSVLGGLAESSDKYRRCSLGVIETLLSVFLVLPNFPNPELEEFCVTVFQFVTDEDRLKHGIPEFLSPICVSVMKLLGRHALRECRATLVEILSDLVKAKGSSEIVTEAARDLKAALVGKR